MKTKEIIYNMLIENTGTHFLDSGGAYGRAWERNQGKTIEDFEREPQEQWVYHKRGNYLQRTVSVFYFNEMGCADWDAEEVYGVSKAQWDWLNSKCEVTIESTFNTYNGDSDLSQILQGSWLGINDEQYLLLQIHGGCDARGGYTDAKLFKPREEYYIHEYLYEYMDSYDINQALEDDVITIVDEHDHSIEYTCEEILEKLNVSLKTH